MKSEYQDHSSTNITVQMKIKIIIALKSNALAVFHSHWSNFAAMKPLLFLIGSADQLDVFCPTVSRSFEFWLNVSFRPRGKQKTASFCDLLCVWVQNLVATYDDCGALFVLWCVLCCVMCVILCTLFFCTALLCVFLCFCVLSCYLVMCCDVLCCVVFFVLLRAFMWFVWCVVCVVVMCCDALRFSSLFFAAFMCCSVLFCVVMCCAFCAVL